MLDYALQYLSKERPPIQKMKISYVLVRLYVGMQTSIHVAISDDQQLGQFMNFAGCLSFPRMVLSQTLFQVFALHGNRRKDLAHMFQSFVSTLVQVMIHGLILN
jgi:hypothetical protein